jgi:flagellar biosynthesis protein FliR
MTDLNAILNHLPPLLLVVTRLGGLMVYGPVFGSNVIPVRLKAFLAFTIGVATYPLLSGRFPSGPELHLNIWTLGPLMAMEMLVGLIVGYLASLPLLAMQTGGLIMGQQMGLGFAQLYNPAIDDEADIIGQMLFFMAIAGFLAIGGHEMMVMAVLNSFERIPPGGFAVDLDFLQLLGGLLLASLELALRVAAPVLAFVFLETIALGFLAKTVPQLNIMTLGFPIRIIAGLAIVIVGLVVIQDVAMEAVGETLNSVLQWVEGGGP